MLGRGVTIFPDNLATGTAGEEAFAYKQGLIEALELRRLGVDLNLGPCLDVLTERYSPNIGIRSYGKDPDVVSRYGRARITGNAKGGLSACVKHFPGKGHSPLDAHLRLPTIDSDWAEMHATHLVPFFAAMEAGVECVMTSHPVYPKLDPSGVPATFSTRIVEEYLRGEVGYQRAAAAALVDAYRTGRLPRRGLDAAADRVRTLRERRHARAEGGPPAPEREGTTLAMAIATRAVTVVARGRTDIKRALNGRVAVIFPRFSDLAARITIEPEVCDERAYVAGVFAPAGVTPEMIVVGIEPTAEEMTQAAERAAAADATVLFLYDAHLYPSNRALLDAVQARARALAVVLLRDPYDASLLADGVLGLTAYGWRKCQMDAVVARLAYP
jgi:beta-N-acetylhexosaminidase